MQHPRRGAGAFHCYGAKMVKQYFQNFMALTLGFASRRITLYRVILEKRAD